MKRAGAKGELTGEPIAPKPPTDESHRQFINRALSFTLLENLFKPVSPLLELVCAGLFVGGAWGRYKFYESLVYLVFRISLMGMDKGVIWYYSQVDEKIYLKTLFRSLSWCFLAFGLMSLLTLGSYYGWIPFSDWVLGKNSEAFHVSGPGLLSYLLVVPLMLISELCIQANVNKRNLKYRILVPGIAVPLVTFGSAIGGRYFVPGGIGLPFCLLAGNGAGALLAIWGFLRAHRPSWSDVSLLPLPPWKLMRYSFPLASANIFSALAARVDIFMLASLSGVHSVEVYTVVCMIGKSLTSIRQSFENILLSTFSTWAKTELTLKLRHYYSYSIWLVMNVQSIFLAFAIFFGAESLGLVSAQYAAGYWVLVATAFLIYLNTVSDFSALLALGMGRTAMVPIVQVIFLAANLGLNLLLIPRWDALGAAMALGFANMVAGTLYLGYLTLYYKRLPLLREYCLSIGAGALMFGVPAAMALHFHFGLIVKAGLFLASLGLGYIVQKTWYRRFNRILHALPEGA